MSTQADPLTTGRRIADTFVDGDIQVIWSASTPDMQKAFGSVDDLTTLRENLLSKFGSEETVLSENVETQAGVKIFTRTSQWSDANQPLEIIVAIDYEGLIAGFWLKPKAVEAPSPHLDYQTKANLRLPVNGEWFVYWGGRVIEDNYHAVDLGQRFAMDLLILRDGKSHDGDPLSLKTYHCWGRPILSSGVGVVKEAVDSLPDQLIGERDLENPVGNHVVIDFGNEEYGFFAHLQKNSVRVSKGDHVKAGQEIGLCGNSGNSSEPHLHFHLQTSPELGHGEGLPAQFINYRADGVLINREEPKKGELIQSTE